MLPIRLHCTALILAFTATSAAAQVPATGEATFTVLASGTAIGQQRVTLTRDASGWLITSTGRLDAPADLTITKFEMKYTPDWQPLELKIDSIDHKVSISLATSFAMTTAINEVTREGRTVSKEDQISARTIVLASNYFAGFEALAARLTTETEGAELPLYFAPNGEVKAKVVAISNETLRSPSGDTPVRRFDLSLPSGNTTTEVAVTVDNRSRLARFDVVSAGLSVVRDDLSGVATRVMAERNPTDADVSVPANGFALSGTITSPHDVAGRLRYPGIVLVGPSGSGRDLALNGVPVFAQLAGALANLGYVVLRYDSRGVAQSGGRTESAALQDYADDAVAAVKWMSKRPDVDTKRVVICGYGEGGAIALLAAAREKQIDAMITIATPAGSGADVLLEQQRALLAGMNIPDAEKQAKIDLQKKIQQAVLTGTGWEDVPANLRRQADTPLFKSQLAFDPGQPLQKARQPMLIVQGDADTQVAPASAERLASQARARKKGAGVEVVHVAAMTHRLTEGTARTVSPKIATAIADWIKKTL